MKFTKLVNKTAKHEYFDTFTAEPFGHGFFVYIHTENTRNENTASIYLDRIEAEQLFRELRKFLKTSYIMNEPRDQW